MTDTATNPATLSELLKLSGSQYRLYDIGRLVNKLPKEQFEKVELNQLPYPTPVQGHACIAIAFWQKQSPQPYLWILKLPLDERGLLNQGARNHFIAIIIEALGADLTQETSKKQEELLSSNPYLFTPAQYKLASLNSKIKVDLKQSPGEHFSTFKEYLSNSHWDKWQHIGVQGITDLVANIQDTNICDLLIRALPHLPSEVLSPVCGALENETFHISLIETLIKLFNLALIEENDTAKAQQLLRALSANANHVHVVKLIEDLLSHKQVDTDLLIIISARCWQSLADEKILISYFEQLLLNDDLTMFSSIFKDLVSIPQIRPFALQCIRNESRSPALANAIGQLFRQS